MSKQTAVEWLVEHFKEYGFDLSCHRIEIEQAKAMEKEQLKEAMENQAEKYTTPYLNENKQPSLSFDIDDSFNDYYNETYGGDK